jgi:hypothetical protein
MRITIAGHACVLVETETARVLVDPVFDDHYASGSMAFFPARRFALDALPAPTALVITHAHLDHFHRPSLERLPRHVPVIAPPHDWLLQALAGLGFSRVVPLGDWATFEDGDLRITATPSDFEWDEFGILFQAAGQTYWHMSDSVVKVEVGQRLRAEHGPLTAVSARYQPVQVLPGYLRGLGSAFDERSSVVEWMEAASVTEPRFLFPYAWGVAYVGRHAWANRYLGPWSPEEAAQLFRRRLPASAVEVPRPGDVLHLSREGVRREPAAASWVHEQPLLPEPEGWEPVDVSTLAGVAAEERAELAERLVAVLADELGPFLTAALAASSENLFHNFPRWGVVYQLVVHAGDGARLEHHLDFREPGARWTPGRHAEANLFGHLSGAALLAVLRGQGGTELFWMSGDVRQYEKILFLGEDGRFAAPPYAGWELFDRLPELLSFYLRRFRR